MAVQVNESNFKQEVLDSTIPVLVDFWAPWCGPCKMMGPVIEEIAEEQQGKLKVCKVNVDDNPNLAQQYGIMSIPNFIVFKEGKPAGQTVGAVGKEALLSLA
ncbi:MAG TPA: thioredoxin [Treponema sp.]|nr:thioredoxin [Treponema sp.]